MHVDNVKLINNEIIHAVVLTSMLQQSSTATMNSKTVKVANLLISSEVFQNKQVIQSKTGLLVRL